MGIRTVLQLSVILAVLMGLNCGTDDAGRPMKPIDPGDTLLNHPPVIRAQPDTSATVGETLVLFAYAEDEDGDSILYGMSNIRNPFVQPNPALVDFDDVTGEFRFHVRVTDIPLQMFEFYAIDAECDSDTTFFVVYVRKS